MGLSSFLAASTDAAQYAVEMAREKTEIEQCPLEEEQEIYDIFAEYGIERIHAFMVVEKLKQDPEMWVKVRKHTMSKKDSGLRYMTRTESFFLAFSS